MAQQKISRTIQWFGLLKIPENIRNKLKYYYLTVDVRRPPLSFYRNDRYSTPRGFWGYVQSMYSGRVMSAKSIDYEGSLIEQFVDTNLFLHASMSCHLEALLTTFVNLGLALEIPPIQRNNPIKTWRNFAIVPEEFRIKLLNERTVAEVNFYYELQDNCEVPESGPVPEPPPPPPPPRPLIPPTEEINNDEPISPPYDGPNDNGFTYNPGNNPPDPDPDFPVGDECTVYTVTVRYIIVDLPGIREDSNTYYGPINRVFVRQPPGGGAERREVAVESRGELSSDITCLADLVVRGGIVETGREIEIIQVTVTEV